MPQSYAPLEAPQRLLFGPGPSMVAPRVYRALSQPVVDRLRDVDLNRLTPLEALNLLAELKKEL